jgi:hypothetical protein
VPFFTHRYGGVESVRLRSVPVQPEAVALPRRAAVLGGRVDADRATAHAYVVFAQPEHAQAALAHNMQVVSPWARTLPCASQCCTRRDCTAPPRCSFALSSLQGSQHCTARIGLRKLHEI